MIPRREVYRVLIKVSGSRSIRFIDMIRREKFDLVVDLLKKQVDSDNIGPASQEFPVDESEYEFWSSDKYVLAWNTDKHEVVLIRLEMGSAYDDVLTAPSDGY